MRGDAQATATATATVSNSWDMQTRGSAEARAGTNKQGARNINRDPWVYLVLQVSFDTIGFTAWYGFCGFRYSVQKPDPQVTCIEPYIYMLGVISCPAR